MYIRLLFDNKFWACTFFIVSVDVIYLLWLTNLYKQESPFAYPCYRTSQLSCQCTISKRNLQATPRNRLHWGGRGRSLPSTFSNIL